MTTDEDQGWGTGSWLALSVVLVFVAVLLFGVLSILGGLLWVLVKFVVLFVVLFLVIRWVLRRSTG